MDTQAKRDRRTRIAFVIQQSFEYFISMFVSGTFLGYILESLGFNDAQQGIILTVATFTCGAQLFALVTTGHRAKRIATVGHLLNQLCFVALYLLPIGQSISAEIKAVIFVVLLFAGHILNNAVNPSMIAMYMDAVPDSSRGSYTAVKEMISLAGGVAVSLGLGWIADTYCVTSVDGVREPTTQYYIICCIAVFIMMAIHTASLLMAHERPVEKKKVSLGRVVKHMFTDKDLLKVIVVGVLWNVASGISVSFFASYLRVELAFSMFMISLISNVGIICRIVASPIMGRLADKKSFAFSMTLSFLLVGIGFLGNIFVTPGPMRWLYLIYACMQGFAMGGINSGVINLIYDYVEPADRAAAMGIKNAIGGIVGFFATLLSSLLLGKIQSLPGKTVEIFGIPMYAQQVLSGISLVFTVGLIIYMRLVIAPMKRVRSEE